jgi:hypothetical protein
VGACNSSNVQIDACTERLRKAKGKSVPRGCGSP